MNTIYKFLFVLIAGLSSIGSLNAANTRTFFNISLTCDTTTPLHQKGFNSPSQTTKGYITTLTINGQEIEPDIQVNDPENFERTFTIPALVQSIQWDGQPTARIYLTGLASSKAKASILEAICSSNDRPKIEAQWVIYSYDHEAKKFFRHFQTENHPIMLTLDAEDDILHMEDPSDRYLDKPSHFMFFATLAAPSGFEDQNLSISFKSNGKAFSFPVRDPDKFFFD